MAREIKFRAWDKRIGKMFYEGFVIEPKGAKGFPEGGWDWSGRDDEDLELMQFTGLRDIKGKEVYEGDVVKTLIGKDELIGRLAVKNSTDHVTGVVEYCPYSLSWLVKCNQNELNIVSVRFGWFSDNYEVLGNSYSNPELISANNL